MAITNNKGILKKGDSVYDNDSLIIIRLDSQTAYIEGSYFTVMFHEYIS